MLMNIYLNYCEFGCVSIYPIGSLIGMRYGVKINHLHVEYTVNPQAGYLKEQGIIHVQFFVEHLIAGR